MTTIIIPTPKTDVQIREERARGERIDRLFAAALGNRVRAGEIAGAKYLEDVPWPTVQHYGFDHAKWTSQLTAYIAEGMGCSQREIDVVKAAAMFHDLGRVEPWQRPDPGHQERSAELARRVLASEHWARGAGQGDLVDEVCSLIARHHMPAWDGNARLEPMTPPTEPLLRALWDAECYESARFAPGTILGLRLVAARMKTLLTPWAQLKEHRERWLRHRGWT